MLQKQLDFSVAGTTSSALVQWFTRKLQQAFQQHAHRFCGLRDLTDQSPWADYAEKESIPVVDQVDLVFNLASLQHPQSFHRRGQGTFVITLFAADDQTAPVMQQAYPALVRSLSNLVVYLKGSIDACECHFITLEQGHYVITHEGDDAAFFEAAYQRIIPLACSRLVINNEFVPDLSEALAEGDTVTEQLAWAGRQLDALGLLPTVFPLREYLSERDLRHVRLLFGIGGLSYGNLSARANHDPGTFWMSASGVNKGKLQAIGRDMLLVTDFDEQRQCLRLSVPAEVEPRRVSVDAIEHFMIYQQHPKVGAIVHIHAWWSDPITSTHVNYPCGTIELAREVADLVDQAPNPSQAVIGLKNHGLTITGHSLDDIFERIEGKIIKQVPME